MARGGAPGRMISGRAVMIVGLLLLVFVVGAMVGGGYTRDDGVNRQRALVESCLPIGDAAQLTACLDGGAR